MDRAQIIDRLWRESKTHEQEGHLSWAATNRMAAEALDRTAEALVAAVSTPVATSMAGLSDEVARQRVLFPPGYPATRNGIRLGIASVEDEIKEVLDAWRLARCKCRTPDCAHPDWTDVRTEALQAAAILVRVVEAIDARGPAEPKPRAVGRMGSSENLVVPTAEFCPVCRFPIVMCQCAAVPQP